MKLILKIFIITILISCSAFSNSKNYKNPLISSESAEEISSESKEKSGDENENLLANIDFNRDLKLSRLITVVTDAKEKRLVKFSEEVPTSPPNS